jgi:putative heme-binding domain-containing protein
VYRNRYNTEIAMTRATLSSRKVLLSLCALSALAPAQQISNREGQQIFATRCATCHGLDGQGAERGPNIAGRHEVQQLSDQALAKIIGRGIPTAGMPSFRALGSTKIEAVVHHLRNLQGHGRTLPLPGDPERGKALFSGKAQCVQCHTVNGEGGFLGSDLTSYASTLSADEIRSAITEPNKSLDPRRQTVVVTFADGTRNIGIARNEDNFTLQLQTADGAFHSFTKSELRSIEHQPRSLMPPDYGTRLSPTEIDDIVTYLAKVGRDHPQQKPSKKDD